MFYHNEVIISCKYSQSLRQRQKIVIIKNAPSSVLTNRIFFSGDGDCLGPGQEVRRRVLTRITAFTRKPARRKPTWRAARDLTVSSIRNRAAPTRSWTPRVPRTRRAPHPTVSWRRLCHCGARRLLTAIRTAQPGGHKWPSREPELPKGWITLRIMKVKRLLCIESHVLVAQTNHLFDTTH